MRDGNVFTRGLHYWTLAASLLFLPALIVCCSSRSCSREWEIWIFAERPLKVLFFESFGWKRWALRFPFIASQAVCCYSAALHGRIRCSCRENTWAYAKCILFILSLCVWYKSVSWTPRLPSFEDRLRYFFGVLFDCSRFSHFSSSLWKQRLNRIAFDVNLRLVLMRLHYHQSLSESGNSYSNDVHSRWYHRLWSFPEIERLRGECSPNTRNPRWLSKLLALIQCIRETLIPY